MSDFGNLESRVLAQVSHMEKVDKLYIGSRARLEGWLETHTVRNVWPTHLDGKIQAGEGSLVCAYVKRHRVKNASHQIFINGRPDALGMEFEIRSVEPEFCGDGTDIRAIAHDSRHTVVCVRLNKWTLANNPNSDTLSILLDALDQKYREIQASRNVYRAFHSYLGTKVASGKEAKRIARKAGIKVGKK
ncbi:MAG: hypothetical protein ABSG57_14210 [Candidatus Bathyarchaeia archaeon]